MKHIFAAENLVTEVQQV